MKRNGIQSRSFTLVEVIFAVALAATLMAFAYPTINTIMFQVKSSGWQTHFIGEARLAQRKINRAVQDQQFMNILDDETVELYATDGAKSTLYYDSSGDINERTISLKDASGDEEVLCSYVSPIDESEPIFQMTTTSNPTRQNLHVAFHVGDPPDSDEAYYKTGPGYQGLELRFTTSPRNLQQWHDFK